MTPFDNVINNFGAGGGGKSGGDSGGSGGQEAPNTLRSKAIADLLYLIGEGEISGFANADPLKSIFINKVPVHNVDGSNNFQGFQYWMKPGTANQTAIPGFDQVSSEFSVGQRVRYGIPVIYSTQGDQLDAVVATLQIPQLTQLDTDNGNLNGYYFNIAIDVKSSGLGADWVTVATDYESGKCTSPYEKSYRIPLHGTTGPWLIRMRRLNPDSDDDSKISDETFFSHITEISEWKVAYADSAVVGVEIDTELLGQQGDIKFDIKGRIINVPQNYNPATRTYTGFWDGTFKLAWSDDPAWVLMDVCMNPRYGIQMPSSSIDKWGLYQLSLYCNEMVPDGFGGTEHRFSFNGTFYSQEEAYKTIQAICSMMRAVSFYAAGALIVRQDRPVPPQERVYNSSNVVGDFVYSASARTARHNACVVEWRNPDLGYENDYEVYEDSANILKYGYQVLQLKAIGTTSRGQAYRQGKWAVLTDQLNADVINFQCGQDSAGVLPGDTIEVADPHWATADFGGRVLQDGTSLGPNQVKLDRPIDYAGATSPSLHLTILTGPVDDVSGIDNTGRPIQRELRYWTSNITAYNSTTHVVTLADNIPTDGDDGVTPIVWIFSKQELNPRGYKVVSIDENTEDHTFSITGAIYDANKYVLMDENFEIDYDPGNNYSNLPPTVYVPPPSNVKLEVVRVGDDWMMHASWTPPTGDGSNLVTGYNCRYKVDDNNWITIPFTKNTSVEWLAQMGNYIFGVKAVNSFGAQSAEITQGLAVNENTVNVSPLSITELFTDRADDTFVGQDIHLYWLSNSTVMRAQSNSINAEVIGGGQAATSSGGAINVDGSTPASGSGAVAVDVTNPDAPTFTVTGTFNLGDTLRCHIGMSTFSFSAPADGTTANAMATGLGNVIDVDPRFDASVVANVITITFSDTETNANTLEAHDDPLFYRYKIHVLDDDTEVELRVEYTQDPEYLYTYANNIQDFNSLIGSPSRTVRFAVEVEDNLGNGSLASEITCTNPPPDLPVINPIVQSGILAITYQPPLDPDFQGIIIWMSTVSGFTPDDSNMVWKDRGNPSLPLAPGTSVFYRYAGYDGFGTTGLIVSEEIFLDLGGESGGGDYTTQYTEIFLRWPTEPPNPDPSIWGEPVLFDSRHQFWDNKWATSDTEGNALIGTDSVKKNDGTFTPVTPAPGLANWSKIYPKWIDRDFGPVWRCTNAVAMGGGVVVPPPSLGAVSYVVTVGHLSTSTPDEDFWGWSSVTHSFGSINGVLMPDGVHSMTDLYWENNHDTGMRRMFLKVAGSAPNSGWSTITVDGHTHSRTSGNYAVVGGQAVWYWDTTDHFDNTVGAGKPVSIAA